MTHASRWHRGVEFALWILGVTLLGVALAATLSRWNYQAQQERALFQRGPAVSVSPEQGRDAAAGERAVVTEVDEPARASAAAVEAHLARPGKASPDKPAAPIRPAETKRPAATADSTAFGRIEIPRLGLAAMVKEGGDEATLSRAVGLVPGSPRPGELGNVVLAGHRDTFFRPLRNIKMNDRIRLIVPPHTYEYQVQTVRVVEPEDTGVLESNGTEELTLVTCFPFRLVGPAPDRFIVTASRVN